VLDPPLPWHAYLPVLMSMDRPIMSALEQLCRPKPVDAPYEVSVTPNLLEIQMNSTRRRSFFRSAHHQTRRSRSTRCGQAWQILRSINPIKTWYITWNFWDCGNR